MHCACRAGTLNRAEWVKFLGVFFNREAAASAYFDTVAAQYNATKVRRFEWPLRMRSLDLAPIWPTLYTPSNATKVSV